MKQPSQQLGLWLKRRRQDAGIVARVFAGQIHLRPSQYAEVESGVVRWLGKKQEQLIVEVLGLSSAEEEEFLSDLRAAREAQPLSFEDVFTREQLEPIRLRNDGKRQPTQKDKEAILNAVFTPLS